MNKCISNSQITSHIFTHDLRSQYPFLEQLVTSYIVDPITQWSYISALERTLQKIIEKMSTNFTSFLRLRSKMPINIFLRLLLSGKQHQIMELSWAVRRSKHNNKRFFFLLFLEYFHFLIFFCKKCNQRKWHNKLEDVRYKMQSQKDA